MGPLSFVSFRCLQSLVVLATSWPRAGVVDLVPHQTCGTRHQEGLAKRITLDKLAGVQRVGEVEPLSCDIFWGAGTRVAARQTRVRGWFGRRWR